jgi:hypothetical protein
MAATAAYITLTHISLDHSASRESFQFSNISATTAAFNLMGGRYGITCKASTYGTVTLQILAFDATTYLTAATAIAADGVAIVDLPAGVYRFALA